jgi:hypothetical protein
MSEDAPDPGNVYERLRPVQASELKKRVRTPAVPVDRLDALLSRQTGWRLAALMFLQASLPTGVLCVALWSFFFLGTTSLWWPVAAAVLLGGLLAVVVLRWASRRQQRLVISWRLIAGETWLLAWVVFGTFSMNDPSWQHTHRGAALASSGMALIGSLTIADAVWRQRKAASRRAR